MSAPETKTAPAFNRNNPYPAKLKVNEMLSRPGSAKDTRLFVVDVSGSNGQFTYNAGDSLGIFPKSRPELVEGLLAKLHLDPEAAIPAAAPVGAQTTLREALTHTYTLNRVSKKFVKAVAEKLPAGPARETLNSIIANEEQLDEYTHTRDFIDVVHEYPEVSFTPAELVATLNKSNPRLYSIASSSKQYPNEVHLVVAVVKYETHGRTKLGLASGYLADQVELNSTDLPVYIQPTRHFHLPSDPKTDVIMVGPGTGIAPFRAFLQEREHLGHTGRNWLFFGDQRKATDFLFEEEFNDYMTKGHLTRLDTAFSRDQETKVYVQTRMKEAGADLWKWLQGGAYFYVCGDAKRMAKDVHQVLIEIAQEHGGLSPEKAKEYIEVTLTKTEKRYLKDVY